MVVMSQSPQTVKIFGGSFVSLIISMGIVGLWEVSKCLYVFNARQQEWYSPFPGPLLFQ